MSMDGSEWANRVAAAVRAELVVQRRTSVSLARHLGISPHTLASRLSGDIPFDLVEVARVAEWLGLSASELVARADHPTT